MSKATLVILYHYMEQANHEYCLKGKIAVAVLIETKLQGIIPINL